MNQETPTKLQAKKLPNNHDTLTAQDIHSESETQRVLGEIAKVLKDGSVEDKASLLRLCKQYQSDEQYELVRDSYSLNDDGTSKEMRMK